MSSDLREAEYSSLRDEMKMNRQYVFERPLAIIGGALVVTTVDPAFITPFIVPIPFILVLLFNLWFTFNRMESTARIVAFLQLAHEQKATTRASLVGWETALAAYRRRRCELSPKKLEGLRSEVSKHHGRDRLRFYPPIFWFHVVFSAIAAIMPMIAMCSTASPALPDEVQWHAVWSTLAVGSVAIVFALFRLRASRLPDVIEEKVVWLAVLQEMDRLLKEECESAERQCRHLVQDTPSADA